MVRAPRTKKVVNLPRSTQFSRPTQMYPVASALWKLIGYQPPLGIVLVKAVGGANEAQIADHLNISLYNVHLRMEKAIRAGLGFLPHEHGSDSGGEETAPEAGTDHS
jgi:hypothetical protein